MPANIIDQLRAPSPASCLSTAFLFQEAVAEEPLAPSLCLFLFLVSSTSDLLSLFTSVMKGGCWYSFCSQAPVLVPTLTKDLKTSCDSGVNSNTPPDGEQRETQRTFSTKNIIQFL